MMIFPRGRIVTPSKENLILKLHKDMKIQSGSAGMRMR